MLEMQRTEVLDNFDSKRCQVPLQFQFQAASCKGLLYFIPVFLPIQPPCAKNYLFLSMLNLTNLINLL